MNKILALLAFTTLVSVVYANNRDAIWYHYKTKLMPYPEKMKSAYDCIFKGHKCSPLDIEARDVYKQMYVDNCAKCCIFRRNMITDMNNYFNKNGFEMTKTPTEMKEILEEKVIMDYDIEP